MKQMVFVFLAGGMVGLAPSSLVAQGIEIVHDGVGCVVAERFPRLEARVEPASAAGRVRIQFRTEGGAGWYFVEMKPAAGLFSGVLPKPKKSLKRFSYYIEVTGTSFEATRTAEYSPAVVTSAQECRAPLPAAGVTSAGSVVVGGPAGAPAVPPGFAASGVTAATATAAGAATGAGVSTGVVLGGVAAGAAAVGGAVALANGGDEEAPPATSTNPSTGGTAPGGGAPSTPAPLPTAYLEFPQNCAILSGGPIRVGQTVTLGFGVGRWPTFAEAQSKATGQTAAFTVDGMALPATYAGVTWHEGAGIPPGWGYGATATWVATRGSHTATAGWRGPSFDETLTCSITPIE